MAIIVGTGMRAQMDAAGDDPIYDHRTSPPEGQLNQDGTKYHWETCWGKKGWYLSSDAPGEWVNLGPLGGPEQ